MERAINTISPIFDFTKDAFIMLFFFAAFIAIIVVTFEIKIYYNFDIPNIDLPFDEWYQALVAKI